MQRGGDCGPWGRACPFPLPPASSLRRGWAFPQPASSSLDLLGPFVLRTAGSVFRPVNFLSLFCYPTVLVAISQKFPPIAFRTLGPPVLTLSNAASSSPFRPHLLVADAGVWGTFLLGVAFRHIICGFYLLFPSQSGCLPRFKHFPQTRQCEGFLVSGNFLY